jgi:hypothetical protein
MFTESGKYHLPFQSVASSKAVSPSIEILWPRWAKPAMLGVQRARNIVDSIAQKRGKLSIAKINHIHAGEFLYTAFSKS